MQDIETQSWCQSHMVPLKQLQDISKLQWHSLVPQEPPHRPYPQPLCFSDAALPQAMQLSAFQAEEQPSASQPYSDDFGGASTSSTGYSRSPPRSPRLKRPSSRTAGLQDFTSAVPFQDRFNKVAVFGCTTEHAGQKDLLFDQAQASHLLFESPKSIDTPDHHRENCAENLFAKEELRERAATGVYGLRRLRACPRWAEDSADMSDDSASEGKHQTRTGADAE